MQQSTKDAVNALQANKVLKSGKPAPPNNTEYLIPQEINTLISGTKEIMADVGNLQTQVLALQQDPPSAVSGPKLSSSDPVNGGISVQTDKVITLVFRRFLYAPSVTTDNIILKDKNNSVIPITLSYDGLRTITINHASGFTIPLSPYSLHITTGLMDLVGESYNAEQLVGFSCNTDTFPSKPVINYDTVTYNSARIMMVTPSTDDLGTVTYVLAYSDGTVIADPVTLPYTFPSLLSPSTNYTVKLGAKDSPNNQTTWSDPITFQTTSAPAATISLTSILNVGNSGFTVKGTIVTSDPTPEIDVVWGNDGNADPNTLFAGTNKIALTGADVTSFTGAGKAISTTLVDGTMYYCWLRIVDDYSTSAWVKSNMFATTTIANGGFESGNLTGWSIAPAATPAISVVAGEPGMVGSYCAKFYQDNPTAMTTFQAYQDILMPNDIDKFSMRFKPVTGEMTYPDPLDAQSVCAIKVAMTPYDASNASLANTSVDAGCNTIYLHGCNFDYAGTWAQGAWKWQANTVNDTWNTFPSVSDPSLKGWITSHLKAGKTWADVAKIRVSIAMIVSPGAKLGFRLDNVEAV